MFKEKNNKKYWLKMEKDFLNNDQFKIIRKKPNGAEYIVFYLALMFRSIPTNGYLRFSDIIPYDEEMLATITETDIDIVRSAIKVFVGLGRIEILDDLTYHIPEVEQKLGCETNSAERKRRSRAEQAQKKLQFPRQNQKKVVTMSQDCHKKIVTLSQNCHIESETELKSEKELEIETEVVDDDAIEQVRRLFSSAFKIDTKLIYPIEVYQELGRKYQQSSWLPKNFKQLSKVHKHSEKILEGYYDDYQANFQSPPSIVQNREMTEEEKAELQKKYGGMVL